MLREPRQIKPSDSVRGQAPRRRLQVVKLEDRIAPRKNKFQSDQGNHYGQNK